MGVETENQRGNLPVYLTVIILPMQAEMSLIKSPELPWSDKGCSKSYQQYRKGKDKSNHQTPFRLLGNFGKH